MNKAQVNGLFSGFGGGGATPGGGAGAGAGAGASLFSSFGGFDGLIKMMGHIQKFYGIYKQVTPYFKMFSSFMQPKAATASIRTAEKPARGRRIQQTGVKYKRQ
ncbi:hypothetical protein [Paenibacillus thalictri]|uniref:hypothetical protein n=1 Tax=Paenibacillus thalictri TaxID=2527873 RepID=UPI0010349783|nr:hypothetical protein [Paenibacillus thalictri]